MPNKIVSRFGDVWILGQHRLMCGDSASRDDVSRLMRDSKAKIVFTSPPYKQQRNYHNKIDDWLLLMEHVFANIPVQDNGQILVNLGLIRKKGRVDRYWDSWIDWMENEGYRLYDWYCWDQGAGLPGYFKGHLAPSHEFIFHFNKEDYPANRVKKNKTAGRRTKSAYLPDANGRRSAIDFVTTDCRVPDSVIRINRYCGRDCGHVAVFPVELPKFIYEVWTDKNDVVYEPFCGSGTSIIAGEMCGRRVFAMEIAPEYCDVAIRRWQKFTGLKAVHATSGKFFDDWK